MLLEFRIKNFKSFRDEIVFSLNANKDKTNKQTHLLATQIKSLPFVVASAAIYGANASGKSNLIEALLFFKGMVSQSALISPNEIFNLKPFALEPKAKESATEFEITFLMDGVRYQYGFAMTSTQIIEEWLYVYKSAKPQQWFYRQMDQKNQQTSFKFSSYLSGQKQVWQTATKENALFLSTAVLLNSEQLTRVFNWITQSLVFFDTQSMPSNTFSTQMLTDAETKQDIVHFLNTADISIDDLTAKQEKGVRQRVEIDPLTGDAKTSRQEVERLKPLFHHKSEAGSAIFELSEESLGTQRLFALAGPILDILKKGRVLIFDELDSSFHTLLAKRLVELFHSQANQHASQLIFTTHDTALLHDDLLRRDQVWFIEKNKQQVSHLYPLTDFSPRKKESIERGYMLGRYGAVPFFQDLLN